MVRVCAARVSSVFGERLPQGVHAWTRCSELRFDPAPHIEHFASASDTVDPFVVDREPLRIQTDGVRFTPIEGFVARALVEIGRDECVSRVRRLQWSDAPRPRHRRASSPKSWRDTAADR
jgi:hypothetical protein